jgi:O-antigen/teichoic acid export membrane protein
MINKKFKKYFNSYQLENIKSFSFGTFIQIIIQFFFPPMILLIWGVTNFGAWIYLISFISITSLIAVPITEVVRLEMTRAYANGKKKYLNEIFFNSIIWHSINLLIIIGLLIFLKNFINLQSIFFSKVGNVNMNFVFVALLLNACFDVLKGFLYPALTFQGKIKLYNNIEIGYEIISKLTILTSAFLYEFDYVIFLYILSGALRLLIIFYFYYFKNYKKNFYIPIKFFNIKIIKKIFFLSATYFLERMSSSIKNDGFIFLIGTYFGAVTIALVSTMKTIFFFFPIKISSILNYSSQIDFSILKFSSYNMITDIQKKYLRIMILFLFIFISGSLLFGKLFYEWWIRNVELNFDYKIMLFIILEVSIVIIFNTIISPFKSLNKFFKISAIDLLISTITFVLCLIAIKTNSDLYNLFFITVGMCLLNLIITISLYKNYLNKIDKK